METQTTTSHDDTTTTSSTATVYEQCGAGGEFNLRIQFDPAQVHLIDRSSSVDLHGSIWSYGFTDDGQMMMRMVSALPMLGWYREVGTLEFTPLTSADGALWLTRERPLGDDEEVEIIFKTPDSGGTTSTAAAAGRPTPHEHPVPPEHPEVSSTPMGPQPTLIIRTKKTCPTGTTSSLLA